MEEYNESDLFNSRRLSEIRKELEEIVPWNYNPEAGNQTMVDKLAELLDRFINELEFDILNSEKTQCTLDWGSLRDIYEHLCAMKELAYNNPYKNDDDDDFYYSIVSSDQFIDFFNRISDFRTQLRDTKCPSKNITPCEW